MSPASGLVAAGVAFVAAALLILPRAAQASISTSPPSPASGPDPSDDAFYRALAYDLGAPWTEATRCFFYAWRQAEGGSAHYNPFNTTYALDGAVPYNRVGVKSYPDPWSGVHATANTLRASRYEGLCRAIRAGTSAREMAEALQASAWGTGSLAAKVVRGYAAGFRMRPPRIATPLGGTPVAALESSDGEDVDERTESAKIRTSKTA